jgi:hypothetical protein
MVTRFRSMGWVGCVAAAALTCYLVSQRVASERGAVERLDRRIVMARIEIRKLQTELGTRSRMPVLEKWNSDVLALSAPSARQYLHGEVQLARFEPAPVPAPRIQQVSAHVEAAAPVQPRILPVAATAPAPVEQPMLRHANYVKPADDFGSGVQPAALLDDSLLGDLRQTAQREKRGSNQER